MTAPIALIKKNSIPAIALIFFLVLIAGCGGPGVLPEMTPERLVGDLQRQTRKLRTFQGYARLSAITEFGSFRGSLNVRINNPDTVWMKVEGPLGIDLGLIRLEGDDALVYSPMSKSVFKGSLSSPAVRRAVPFEILTERMVLGIQGLPALDRAALDSLSGFTSQNGEYLLSLGAKETLHISPKGPEITRWDRTNAEGRVIWSWEASQFRKVGKVRLPRMVRVTQQNPTQQLMLYYDWAKTNQAFKAGWADISIPEDAHVVTL